MATFRAALFRSPPLAFPSRDPFAVGKGGGHSSWTAAYSSVGVDVDGAKFPLFSMSSMRHHRLNIQTAAGKKVSRCECHDLFEELVPYVTAWKWQKEIVDSECAASSRGEEASNSVILLQHPPVYTMGTRSSDSYLRFDKENPPFELHVTERGGEVTYHGPGQLVMYPILNLRNHKMDLHWYLRMLEEVVIRTLSSACGLEASRIDGLTGVWVGEVKVAAIGVRVSRWITYHGLALNVTTDLAPFQSIVPCGIDDRPVGSIQQLLGTERNREKQKSCPPKRKEIFGIISRGIENGSCRRGISSDMSKAVEKTVWDDAVLLRHVHDVLLAEFAEVFQVQLVRPTRDGPKTLRVSERLFLLPAVSPNSQ